MKKTLAAIAASVVMALPAWAQNVGDPMPKLRGPPITMQQFTSDIGALLYENGMEMYKFCPGIEPRPYGTYFNETDTVYLDNKGYPDGIVDEVVVNPGSRDALADAPDCPMPI